MGRSSDPHLGAGSDSQTAVGASSSKNLQPPQPSESRLRQLNLSADRLRPMETEHGTFSPPGVSCLIQMEHCTSVSQDEMWCRRFSCLLGAQGMDFVLWRSSINPTHCRPGSILSCSPSWPAGVILSLFLIRSFAGCSVLLSAGFILRGLQDTTLGSAAS